MFKFYCSTLSRYDLIHILYYKYSTSKCSAVIGTFANPSLMISSLQMVTNTLLKNIEKSSSTFISLRNSYSFTSSSNSGVHGQCSQVSHGNILCAGQKSCVLDKFSKESQGLFQPFNLGLIEFLFTSKQSG